MLCRYMLCYVAVLLQRSGKQLTHFCSPFPHKIYVSFYKELWSHYAVVIVKLSTRLVANCTQLKSNQKK